MKKFSKVFTLILFALLVVAPSVSFAQTQSDCPFGQVQQNGVCINLGGSNTLSACTSGGIDGIICRSQRILNSLLPLLIALGVVYFLWGVVQYVIAGGEEAKSKGRDRMIYGIIGLAVIVGVWGLVNIVVNTFNLGGQNAPAVGNLIPVVNSSTTNSGCGVPDPNNPNTGKFQNYICYIIGIISNSIIPLIFALAVLLFVWGVVQFFIASDQEEKRAQGKQFIIWGVIALAVMLSVWGLVKIVGNTFNLNTSVLPHVSPSN